MLIGLLSPPNAIWLPRKVPVYLVRFYDETPPTRTSRPIAEHVYKPSGMWNYIKGKPVKHHYLYEKTNLFKKEVSSGNEKEMSELRSQHDEISAQPERSVDGGTPETVARIGKASACGT